MLLVAAAIGAHDLSRIGIGKDRLDAARDVSGKSEMVRRRNQVTSRANAVLRDRLADVGRSFAMFGRAR